MRSLVTGRGLIVGAAKDVAAGPERGATHTAVVATLLARHDLSRYERVLVGAGPAPRDRPANVTASWGMTETGSGVVYDGRALPGVEIAVVDGELLVRSATLASRYLHGPLAWTIGPDGSSTWLATGDGARLDEGQLVVTGRISTMINSGGEKLWPLALERTLQSLPHEGGWVALGEDDPEWGQRLVVVVEGRGDLAALLADARALLAEHHGSAAKPKSIVAVDRIPRTSNGKVKYDELRRLVELSPHRLTAE
jgi:O-succinylbenzoic acid--CoA ligase